jgi:CRP-like cAMP-binding protein
MLQLTQSLAAGFEALDLRSGSQVLSLEGIQVFASRTASAFSRRDYLPTHGGHFWLLQSGVVRILTYQEDGTAVALGIWQSGDIVGSPLTRAQPYLIETLTPVEAVSIRQAEWQPPRAALLSYLHQSEALMLIRANRRADLALIKILQWLADRFGQQIDRGCLIDLKLTHQDLADFSGTTRVTVTRSP